MKAAWSNKRRDGVATCISMHEAPVSFYEGGKNRTVTRFDLDAVRSEGGMVPH
jgi:hypothetical protein